LEIRGKTVKFGNDVNTDLIIPGKYLTTLDPQELAKHAMEGLDPEFAGKASEGVIIVAGGNFGCGSSREQAPIALKYAGVNAVLAESFARIFHRNAINIGLPILECPGILGKVDSGDELNVDLAGGSIVNLSKNESFQAIKFPDFLLKIIGDGGLIEHLKRRLRRDGLL
jgi:3-isopropylmalate/(R)-2-methylmalate dehydratase small subunit